MSGRRIENLVSGVDRSANGVAEFDLAAINNVRRSPNADTLEAEFVNKIAQVDVGALLNAGAQGPGQQQGPGQAQPQSQTPGALRPAGPSDIDTSNVGADLANQIAENGTAPAVPGQTPGESPAAAAPASGQGLGQGQGQGLRPAGPGDIDTSNIAGDLANQLAPAPGVNGQRPASNAVAGELANQIAGGGAPSRQGQLAVAQSGGAGLAVVEIRSTIIQEANGQQIATAVIEQLGQGQQQAAAPAPTEAPAPPAPQEPAAPAQAPPAEAPPAQAPPAEAPAVMPVPSETLIRSSAAEAAASPESQPTQLPAEGISANVRIRLPINILLLIQTIGHSSYCTWYNH